MEEVNDKEFTVSVIGPYTFSIGDTSGYSDYVRGGVAIQVTYSRAMSLFMQLIQGLYGYLGNLFRGGVALKVIYSGAV